MKFFEENNQRQVVTMEKLSEKNLKQIELFEQETNKTLESLKGVIAAYNDEHIKKNKDTKGKLETFISNLCCVMLYMNNNLQADLKHMLE